MTTIGIFRLPYTPYASKNRMHGRTKAGRIFVHPKARAWRKQFSQQVKKWIADNGITTPEQGHPVSVAIVCHFPPQGGWRGHKADAGNFVDLTLDSVKDGLGIDDCTFSVSARPGNTDPKGGGYLTCQIEL